MAGELKENPKERRRAHHAGRPGPQRRRPGRQVRHGARRRADDARAVQPRDAPHVAGQSGELRRRQDADRRAAGDAAGRHRQRCAEGAGDGDHRRARTGQARAVRRASSATSTSAATSTRRSRSARCSSAATASGRSLQAGAGIVADSVPDDEDLECRNKAAALLAAIPAARRMTTARRQSGTPA